MFSYMNRGRGFYRQVAVLAAPIILQNLITSTLGMADTFMVGMLGQAPMAAVALANIPLFVIQLFIFGIQSGSSVLISQYWGKQDLDAINRVLGIAWAVVTAVCLTAALVLFLAPVQFLSLFGNDAAVIAMAAEYGHWAGFSYLLNSFTMIYVAAYRSMEQPQLGMYILVCSMCVNTFLNWVLIFGKLGAPALGVEGAAIATLIARGVEVLIVLGHMAYTRGFRIKWRLVLRPGLDMGRRFLRYGAPVAANETMWGLGTAIFPTIMGHMANSTEILAAYTIVSNVEKLCMVVAFGISSTACIIIGREVGAGRAKTVHQVGLALNALAALGGLVLGLLLLLFTQTLAPMWLFPLFKLSPGARSIAGMMLVLLALTMPLKDFNSCNIVGVLRGGGDVRVATLIDLGPLWLVAIPVAALAGVVLRLDIFWVYLAISLEQGVKFFVGVWRLRSGRWVRDLTGAGNKREVTTP